MSETAQTSALGAPTTGWREIAALPIDELIRRVAAGSPFSTVKLNHGMWGRVVRLESTVGVGPDGTLATAPIDVLTEAVGRQGANWPASLLVELLATLQVARERPELMLLVSPFGWRGAEAIEGTPAVGLDRVEDAIDRYLPRGVPIGDGLVWKTAIEEGSFVRFVEELRTRRVVIVAPDYAGGFASCSGLSSATFVSVDERSAAWQAATILERAVAAVEACGPGAVTLIEAGGVTSSWLCCRLAERCPGSTNLALGQALNLFSPEMLRRTNWFCVYGPRILATARAIYPDVDHLWGSAGSKSRPQPFRRPIDSVSCRDRDLAGLVAGAMGGCRALSRPPSSSATAAVDPELLQELLALPRHQGRGAVSRLLEQVLHELLALPQDREVVLSASGADALHNLVELHQSIRGAPCRWVVSAFAPAHAAAGPLASSRILDCDQTGMLDLEPLHALRPQEWDGLMLTNPFGLAEDYQRYVEFCRERDKAIIVDNTAALFTAARDTDPRVDEAIGFDGEVPWGVEAGGCMIVAAEQGAAARGLVARGGDGSACSDQVSALMLQRLVNLPRWADLYRLQARRVSTITARAQLRPLVPHAPRALLARLPMISTVDGPGEWPGKSGVAVAKCHRPLSDDASRAAELSSRIVELPCHPGVSACPTEQLAELAARLAGGAG